MRDSDRRESVKKLITALPGFARDVLVDLYHSAYPSPDSGGTVPSAEKELFSALRATLNSLTVEGALSRRAFLQLGGIIATGGLLQALYPEKAHAWQAWTGFWQNISANSYVASSNGSDPYWDYVVLLMNFDGSNGSTLFADESNVGQGPTNSGPIYCDSAVRRASMAGSARFTSANSSYLTFAHIAGFAFGSSDFTIECFLRLNATGSQFISAHHNYGSVAQFYFALNSSSQVYFNGYVSNSAPALVGTTSLTTGAFYHIAVTRSGGTLRLFVNGTQEASASISGSLDNPGTPWNIGRQTNGSLYLDGWLSDYRVYNGVAKYTANFTPPSAAIGLGSSNDPNWGYCVLACPFENTLKDMSGKRAVTTGGPTLSTGNKKFGTASAALSSTNSQYITVSGSDLDLSSGNWTIECWIYKASSGQQTFVSLNNGSYAGINFWVNSSSQIVIDDGVNGQTASTATISLNTWYHIAAVRIGTVTTVYLNGQAVLVNSFSPQTSSTLVIGRYNNPSYYYWDGYIDSLRVTNGYARYTAPFTPPTAAFPVGKDESSDPFWNSTTFLLQPSSGETTPIDLTGRHTLTLQGDAAISSTSLFSGKGSVAFDGTGDYLTSASSSDWSFGSGNFTWEVWAKTANPASDVYYLEWPTSGGHFALNVYSSGWRVGDFGTTDARVSGTASLSASGWYHLAACRSGGTLYFYVNGALFGTANVSSTTFTSSGSFFIGAYMTGAQSFFSGNIASVRITKGTARYTQNFTPPTRAFATTATVLVSDYDPFWAAAVLAMSGQGSNGATPTTDNVGDTLTTTGGAQIVTSGSPKFYGSHYSFNGSSYLTATPDSLFDLGISGEPFTIRLWMKSTYTAVGQYILSHGVGGLTWGSGGEQWLLFCSNSSGGYIAFQWVGSGSPSSVATTTTLLDGVYHHIEVSYDGTTTYLFVDGVLKNSSTGTYTKQTGGSTSTRIGGQVSGSAHFNGNLTDVEVYKGICLHTVSFCPPIKGISTVGYGSSGLNIVTSGLVASLDAGAYDGSSQTWRNTVGSPADSSSRSAYNFYLGSSSSSESSDPGFVGVPLGGTANDYFSMNGSQYFTIAGGNTTFINSMHKKGAQFTIIGVFMITSSGGYTLFGTSNYNAGNARGVTVMGSTTEITFTPYQDNGSNMGSLATSTGAISLGVPHFVAVSITEAGSSFIYLDGSYAVSPQTFTYSQTITTDVPNTAKIGTYADAGGRTLSGRLYQLMLYNRALSKAEVDQIFGALRGRYGI